MGVQLRKNRVDNNRDEKEKKKGIIGEEKRKYPSNEKEKNKKNNMGREDVEKSLKIKKIGAFG